MSYRTLCAFCRTLTRSFLCQYNLLEISESTIMEAVRSWADRLAELCNAYDGVESAAFNWMVKSGGRLSNYACIVSFQASTSAPGRLRRADGQAEWPVEWPESIVITPWRISSGGSPRTYSCRLIVPSWYLLRDSIHRTLAEGEKEKWTAHKDKLAEAMAELDEVSTFSVTRMHFYF